MRTDQPLRITKNVGRTSKGMIVKIYSSIIKRRIMSCLTAVEAYKATVETYVFS